MTCIIKLVIPILSLLPYMQSVVGICDIIYSQNGASGAS